MRSFTKVLKQLGTILRFKKKLVSVKLSIAFQIDELCKLDKRISGCSMIYKNSRLLQFNGWANESDHVTSLQSVYSCKLVLENVFIHGQRKNCQSEAMKAVAYSEVCNG